LQYIIVYVFRIELYTMEAEYIMSLEMEESKYGTYTNQDHYKDIAVKANKSTP
jgi:hypothetical protein